MRWNGKNNADFVSDKIRHHIITDDGYVGERIVMYSRMRAKTRRIVNEIQLIIEWNHTRHFHDDRVYKYPMELYFPHGVKLWRQFSILRHASILITPDGFSMSFGLFLPRGTTIIILQVFVFASWTVLCSDGWLCMQSYRCSKTSSTVDGLIEQILDVKPDYFTWVWTQTQRMGINMVLSLFVTESHRQLFLCTGGVAEPIHRVCICARSLGRAASRCQTFLCKYTLYAEAPGHLHSVPHLRCSPRH